jgi:hypothetical protein
MTAPDLRCLRAPPLASIRLRKQTSTAAVIRRLCYEWQHKSVACRAESVVFHARGHYGVGRPDGPTRCSFRLAAEPRRRAAAAAPSNALEQSAVRLERRLSRELLRFAEVIGDCLFATVALAGPVPLPARSSTALSMPRWGRRILGPRRWVLRCGCGRSWTLSGTGSGIGQVGRGPAWAAHYSQRCAGIPDGFGWAAGRMVAAVSPGAGMPFPTWRDGVACVLTFARPKSYGMSSGRQHDSVRPGWDAGSWREGRPR